MLVTGVAAAFSIPSAQSLVALSFENPSARVKAFGAWGACGSSGFVCEPRIRVYARMAQTDQPKVLGLYWAACLHRWFLGNGYVT